MLQAILLAMLGIELAIYVAAYAYFSARGGAALLVASGIVALALSWRVSQTLASFTVAALLRSGDGRTLPWGNSMAALGDEIVSRIITFSWRQPFLPFSCKADPINAVVAHGVTPILLVHGYVCNRGLWARLSARLALAGAGPVYTINLEPLFGGIDALVPKLAARVDEILAQTGGSQIMVVAHSMGGLVTRAYRTSPAAAHIAKFVTLGSPHHGSRMARLGVGQNSRQMADGSAWLAQLAQKEQQLHSRENPPPTLSIYTLNDDLVYPPESSVLDWAENVPVSAVGHVGLVFSPSVARRVIEFLR